MEKTLKAQQSRKPIEVQSLVKIATFLEGYKAGRQGNILPLGNICLEILHDGFGIGILFTGTQNNICNNNQVEQCEDEGIYIATIFTRCGAPRLTEWEDELKSWKDCMITKPREGSDGRDM